MAQHKIRGRVQRFPGERGWFYLPLPKKLCTLLEADVRAAWPALLKADCSVGGTRWSGTIMPIKDGPLFVSLPAKVRKAEALEVDQPITLHLDLDER